FARGCSDHCSAVAANSSTWLSNWAELLAADCSNCGCNTTTSVTLGLPFVSVPVLSNIATVALLNASMASPPLNITPFEAPLPIPTMTAVGVASPRAHGQATTNIATAGIIADARSPGTSKYHAPNVVSATIITTYAKYPATLSTSFCIGGFLPSASSTSRTICERNESEPTLVALTSSMPSLFTVPATMPSPSFLWMGMDSPVTIDSSTADSP